MSPFLREKGDDIWEMKFDAGGARREAPDPRHELRQLGALPSFFEHSFSTFFLLEKEAEEDIATWRSLGSFCDLMPISGAVSGVRTPKLDPRRVRVDPVPYRRSLWRKVFLYLRTLLLLSRHRH